MAEIPETHRDLLERPLFAHVATLGPDGEPQSNPVWFDFDGTHVRFSQTKGRQKVRNLERDPRIALSILDLENPYRYLELRGRVVEVEDDADNAFIDRMAKRYIDQDAYPWHQPGDERIVMVVAVEHTTKMG